MIPNCVIWLSRFPETLNGKININELPNKLNDTMNIMYVQNNNIEPRNEIEIKLCKLFSEIIGCNNVSVTENVLNIGATSIMFVQFVSKINENFGKKITVEQFIKNSTVETCAKLLEI
jgi:bacitracin synthase 3